MKWISVNDQLPKPYEGADNGYSAIVIGTNGKIVRPVIYYHLDEIWVIAYDIKSPDDEMKVTHWMEFPQPPKNNVA